MTLDEAIKHCLEVAEKNECKMTSDDGCTDVSMKQCAADHRQLAEWLTELKDLREENKVLISECDRLIKEKGKLLKKSEQIAEYKRLLKAAVDDLKFESQCRNCKHKEYGLNTICKECRGNKYEWRYAAEALALIGEEGENNGTDNL